jgi:acyl carrier protein
MNREEIRRILADAFEVAKEEEVDPDTIQDDVRLREGLGIDSLDVMEVVFEIEERLRIKIGEQDMQGVETVGAVLEMVEKKLSEKGPDASGP